MKFNTNDQKVWFTSDTHFGHANVVKFDKSPYLSNQAKSLGEQIQHCYDNEEKKRLKRLEKDILQNDVEVRDADIIKNWNELVDEKDFVIHLGDFSFHRNDDRTISILNQLNGRIVLISGNHDQNVFKNKDIKDKFVYVRNYHRISVDGQSIALFHYPIHEWDQAHRGTWHLHGHTHTKDDYETNLKRCNVGIMNWDYKPVSMDHLKIFMADKENKPHHD